MAVTTVQVIQSRPAEVREPALTLRLGGFPDLQRGDSSGPLSLVRGQLAHSAATGRGADYSLVVEPSSSGSSEAVEEIVIPTLHGLGRKHAKVTLNVRQLLSPLWALVVSKALQTNFPVREGKLDIEHDVDENTYKVVVRIYTAALPAQAIAFWNSLETELDQWLARLSPLERSVLVNDIALRFHWNANL